MILSLLLKLLKNILKSLNIISGNVLISYNYFKCDEIALSSADRGAHIVLSFFEKIKNKKNIYYFVIGGSLYRNITNKNWRIN